MLKATRFVGRLDHDELLGGAARRRRGGAAQPLRAVRLVALEAAAAGTPLVTSNVGGLGEAVIDGETGMSLSAKGHGAVGRRRSAPFSTIRPPPSAARVAARERLTSDFDWHTVADETAQVYLAAKRRERQPLPRQPIVEHALPDR